MAPHINLVNLTTTASNPNQAQDGDLWEVKAFAEDTNDIAKSNTWAPKSYTCTFCRKEYRSAQALGGHMNVHRRDRAKLHQTQPESVNPAASSPATSSTLIIPHGGLCVLYQLPHPAGIFTPTNMNACYSLEPPITNSALGFSRKAENIVSDDDGNRVFNCKESEIEELDLELRLGRGP